MKPTFKHIFWCFLFISAKVFAQIEAVPVAELSVNVPGTKTAEEWEKANPKKAFAWPNYLYGFKEGDYILLDLKADDNATYELEVKEFSSGSVIYSAKDLTKIKRLQLPVPKKAAYEFTLRTTFPENSVCKLSIKRIPAATETKTFNPHVSWQTKADTTYAFVNEKVLVKTELQPQVLVDKTFRVFSQASIGNPSRVTVLFKLPANTKHWVYWLGVGQESVKELEETTKMVAKGGGALLAGVNPIAAFGMGLLPYLPQVKSSGYVDYLFMNQAAIKGFEEEGTRKPFSFAQGRAVVSDYGKITLAQTPKTSDGTLYMGIENKNTVTGLDVVLKIVAFQEEKQYETRRVKKVVKITQLKTPVFGE